MVNQRGKYRNMMLRIPSAGWRRKSRGGWVWRPSRKIFLRTQNNRRILQETDCREESIVYCAYYLSTPDSNCLICAIATFFACSQFDVSGAMIALNAFCSQCKICPGLCWINRTFAELKDQITHLPDNADHSVAKQKFKITNWSTYNKALINRGSITFWLDDEAIQA